MSGDSGTPLPRKLGIIAGTRCLLDGAPPAIDVAADGAVVHRRISASSYDVIVTFCPASSRLAMRWDPLAARLATAGRLWVAWPKRASGVATDLDENRVRDFGLARGLVDVKVCAIDDTWSGLAFVRRLADR